MNDQPYSMWKVYPHWLRHYQPPEAHYLVLRVGRAQAGSESVKLQSGPAGPPLTSDAVMNEVS